MNRTLLTLFLLASSPFLLADNLITDWMGDQVDKKVDQIAEEIKEKVGSGQGSGLVESGQDILSEWMEKDKEDDPRWFERKEGDWNEERFDGSIERFFLQFNGPSALSTPLVIHPANSKITPSPLLESDVTSVEVPEFSLGDRPVDFIRGGHNAAKNTDMKNALEQASTGAVYRYLVGLETTSPLLASAVKQIQTWANQLNGMSILSYDLAAAMLPGNQPKIQRAHSLVCEQELIARGKDLITARTLCQDEEKRKQMLKEAAKRNGETFVGKFNVAEKILSQMGVVENRDLLMNMTGTLIFNGSGRIDSFPPLYKQVLLLLKDGTKIEEGYRSGSHGQLLRGPLTLDTQPQKQKILDLCKSIQQKLREDSPLSEEEKIFLGSSHLPMTTLLALMTQYQGIGSSLILERYADLIAFDRSVQFMEEAAQNILYKAESLRAAQISGWELEEYIKQVREMLAALMSMKSENRQKIEEEKRAVDSLFSYEKGLREKARLR